MKIAQVYIEHQSSQLDRTFTYKCADFDVCVGIRVKVPFRNRMIVGFVAAIEEKAASDFSYSLKSISALIDEKPLLNDELIKLAAFMSDKYITPYISCIQTMLPKLLKPRSTKSSLKLEAIVEYVKIDPKLTKKQLLVCQEMQFIKSMKRVDFYHKYKSVGKKCIESGCLKVKYLEAQATISTFSNEANQFKLNSDQQKAFDQIRASNSTCFLLHGVTGSGKSEVFLRLAQDAILQDKQVCILVPEIGLTPQMITLVKQRFDNKVAIYHSHLNEQEKYEQYQLVKQKKVSIVVGTRSAIFMPFDHIGYIILDEEHDSSYKQDKSPRYHTRDIAIERAKYHSAKVVLASATPSLESYARALKKVYELVEMPNRINDNLPEVKLISMKDDHQYLHNSLLSKSLVNEIEACLSKQEQVLLLLNRRGYSPLMRCSSCNTTLQCPHCDFALSYHKESSNMKCHTCNYTTSVPDICPTCNEKAMRFVGSGTQKLEEHVQQLFPSARILRMDADSTRKKNGHAQILAQIANKSVDILLGTQMIAKGLDFENITLVGILQGDALLTRSDYRSGESTYQLLAQASGRSGRGNKKGKVLIQTYDTNHYALKCAQAHDYANFFKHEMNYRHMAMYPPYSFLISLLFVHLNSDYVDEAVKQALSTLTNAIDIKILGPIELGKRKDEYRTRIILKGKNENKLHDYVKILWNTHQANKMKAKLEIDMQAQNLE